MRKHPTHALTWPKPLLALLALLPQLAHAHPTEHPDGLLHWVVHAWPALMALVVGLCFIAWQVFKRKR